MTPERVIAQQRAAFADKGAYSSASPPTMKALFYFIYFVKNNAARDSVSFKALVNRLKIKINCSKIFM